MYIYIYTHMEANADTTNPKNVLLYSIYIKMDYKWLLPHRTNPSKLLANMCCKVTIFPPETGKSFWKLSGPPASSIQGTGACTTWVNWTLSIWLWWLWWLWIH